MKEGHSIAIVFIVLISALILGSFYQADAAITGGGSFFPELVGSGGGTGPLFWILVVVVLIVAAVAFHSLYFRDHLHRKRIKKFPRIKGVEFKPSSLGLKTAKVEKSDLDKVIDYVSNQRSKGKSDDEIRLKLRAVGWSPDIIDSAII